MFGRKKYAYWALFLVLIYACNLIMSVSKSQARYVNTAVWNTVAEPRGVDVVSNYLVDAAAAPLTILLGEIPQEATTVDFALVAVDDAMGYLFWEVDQPEYLDVKMAFEEKALDQYGAVNLPAGFYSEIYMTLIPTEKACNTVHDAMDVNITVNWCGSLRGTFRATLPAVTEEDLAEKEEEPTTEPTEEPTTDPTEPTTEPTEGEPTDPTEGEPTDPTEGEPTDPTEGENTDPTEGEATDPTEGEATDPTEGETTDPTEGETTDPTEGETTDPTEGEDTDPTEGEATDPTEGDATDPTEGEATDPTEGEATDPTEGEATDPTEGEATDPTEGEATDPTEGDATDPTEGDATDPMEGEGTDPTEGEDTDPTEGDATDPTEGDATDPTEGENTDPTEGEDTDPTEATSTGKEENPVQVLQVSTVSNFARELTLPVSISLLQSAEQVRLGLGSAGETETEMKPFPRNTCFSLDNGSSYYMLYNSDTITLDARDKTRLPVLLDFSRAWLGDVTNIMLYAEAYNGEAQFGLGCGVTSRPNMEANYQVSSPVLTPHTPLEITLPAAWSDAGCALEYSIEMLVPKEPDEEITDIPVEAAEYIGAEYQSVDLSTESLIGERTSDEEGNTMLTLKIGEVLPQAGTYRLNMNWSYEGISFAQTQLTFFINISAYSETDRTGGAEQ